MLEAVVACLVFFVMLSMALHAFDFESEPFWLQIVGGLLLDVKTLCMWIGEVLVCLLNIVAILLLPFLIFGDWLYRKWIERSA